MINRALNKFNQLLFKFNPKINKNIITKKIGTFYGGYDIYDNQLKIPNIISCGLGEDATFDIEMINNYNAKIFAIDPTPRAKNHYLEICKNFGKANEKEYNESGNLDVRCYDLKKVNKYNFLFLEKAIWGKKNEKLKLFYPQDQNSVSCSIDSNINSENNYFYSETITYESIIENYGLKRVDILKLDIEGAEIDVLKDVIKSNNLPKQILVEFDIRRKPSLKNKKILKQIHNLLLSKYDLIKINTKGDFTYLLIN